MTLVRFDVLTDRPHLGAADELLTGATLEKAAAFAVAAVAAYRAVPTGPVNFLGVQRGHSGLGCAWRVLSGNGGARRRHARDPPLLTSVCPIEDHAKGLAIHGAPHVYHERFAHNRLLASEHRTSWKRSIARLLPRKIFSLRRGQCWPPSLPIYVRHEPARSLRPQNEQVAERSCNPWPASLQENSRTSTGSSSSG
jgi:hypothetical protein